MASKRLGWKTGLGMGLVVWGLWGSAAQAHDGVIQVVGAITTPSCNIAPADLVQMQQQGNVISRAACRTVSIANPSTSTVALANIDSNTTDISPETNSSKQLLTVTYR